MGHPASGQTYPEREWNFAPPASEAETLSVCLTAPSGRSGSARPFLHPCLNFVGVTPKVRLKKRVKYAASSKPSE
jgi:hypothetical protein